MFSFAATAEVITIAGEQGSGGSYSFGKNQFTLYKFPDRDLVRIIFDKNCRQRTDMSKHLYPFVDGAVISSPFRLEYDIDTQGRENRYCVGGTSAVASTKKIVTRLENPGFPDILTTSERTWEVKDCEGFKGLCGYPYIDGSIKATKRIFGIHVGGEGTRSLVVPIFIEDISIGLNNSEADFIAQMPAGLPWFDNEEMNPVDSDIYNQVPSYAGLRFIAKQKRKPYMPMHTKLRSSPIQDGIYDTQGGKTGFLKCPYKISRMPAALSGNGETTPLQKAMNKYTTVVTPKINPRLAAIIEDDRTWEGVFPQSVINRPRRRLTMDECVLGVPDLGIKPMDLKTSPGYPFTAMGLKTSDLIIVKRWKGRNFTRLEEIPNSLTGKITVEYHPMFLEAYNKEMEYYKRGEVPPHFVNDTLKDELRSLDRVKDLNTRLFNAGSKVTLMIIKQIEGHLYADLEAHRNETDIAIGMNVHSAEWANLHNNLLTFVGSRKTKGIVEEDFKNWDRCMSRWIQATASTKVKKWIGYELTQIESFIITASWLSCFSSIHNGPMGFFIVEKEGSTGDFRTSWKNSMHNSVMHRAAFAYLAPEDIMWQWSLYVIGKFYGDDVILAIKEYVRGWFSMVTLHEFLKEHFGFTTTTPGAKDKIDIPFTTLEKATFLKRSFVVSEANGMFHIFPQLDRDSVEAMVLWVEGQHSDTETHEILYQTCQSAMMEWFYYGESEYNANYRILQDRMNVLGRSSKTKPQLQRFYVKEYQDRLDSWTEGYKDQ